MIASIFMQLTGFAFAAACGVTYDHGAMGASMTTGICSLGFFVIAAAYVVAWAIEKK